MCSTSDVTKEAQIKTSLTYNYIPIGWLKCKILTTPNVDRNTHSLLAGMPNDITFLQDSLEISYKTEYWLII